ncbi:MAG: DUF4258 domain-containing protein [Anaerolineales bacterium]
MAQKPIRFSNHARRRIDLRGAIEAEVVEAIQTEQWKPTLLGKWQVQKVFQFGKPSPVNQKIYALKTIRAVFADEEDSIVVITVIVFYGNKE